MVLLSKTASTYYGESLERNMHTWAASHITYFRWTRISLLGTKTVNNGTCFFIEFGNRYMNGSEPLSLSGRVNEPASRTANARRRPALHRRLGLGRCGGSAARRGGPARDEARQRCTARGNGSASRPCTARRTTLMFLSSPACLHGLRARPVRGAPPDAAE